MTFAVWKLAEVLSRRQLWFDVGANRCQQVTKVRNFDVAR